MSCPPKRSTANPVDQKWSLLLTEITPVHRIPIRFSAPLSKIRLESQEPSLGIHQGKIRKQVKGMKELKIVNLQWEEYNFKGIINNIHRYEGRYCPREVKQDTIKHIRSKQWIKHKITNLAHKHHKENLLKMLKDNK